MNKFSNDINKMMNYFKNLSLSIPKLYFIETSPQHFQLNGNGYFYHPKYAFSNIKNGYCIPHNNNSESKSIYKYDIIDWRNIIMHKLLEANKNIEVINLFSALESQFDSHFGLPYVLSDNKKPYNDCVHWCNGGNVMKYMLTTFFNIIININ